MIGYHYTSLQNWEKIREQGMKPYVLRRDIVPDGVPGIWLFKARQRALSHAGCILFQIKMKGTLDVVELAVAYAHAQTERAGWRHYQIQHEGTLLDGRGKFIAYYHREAPAMICWEPLPPEQIQLLGVYHMQDAWTQTDEQITVGLHEYAAVRKVSDDGAVLQEPELSESCAEGDARRGADTE